MDLIKKASDKKRLSGYKTLKSESLDDSSKNTENFFDSENRNHTSYNLFEQSQVTLSLLVVEI